MLASWVRDSTTTTGTGTITLAGTPDAGFIGFDDGAFNDGDIVKYTIQDGNNKEDGIGTLSSGASWVLSRDTIIEKLESGAHSFFPASGLSLSGSAVVGIQASAATTMTPRIEYEGTYSAGFIPRNGNQDSSLFSSVSADRAETLKTEFLTLQKVSSLGIYVYGADAGATNTKIGIYDCLPDTGAPGKLLCEASIDVTSTGMKTASIGSPIYLTPGSYWLAVVSDGTPQFRSVSPTSGGSTIVSLPSDTIGRSYYPAKSLTGWSNLPDPFGTPSTALIGSRATLTILR